MLGTDEQLLTAGVKTHDGHIVTDHLPLSFGAAPNSERRTAVSSAACSPLSFCRGVDIYGTNATETPPKVCSLEQGVAGL
jgi:hypothetical protein